MQRVKLLIEDARSPKPIKISQDILLTVIDQVQCGPQEWRVSLRELLEELQSSNSALTGFYSPLAISTPHILA